MNLTTFSEIAVKEILAYKIMPYLGQTNLISGSTDFFQNLKGRSVGREKKENKKKSPIFCVGFGYR